MRRLLTSKSGLAIGVKMALAISAQAKTASTASSFELPALASANAAEKKIAAQKIAGEQIAKLSNNGKLALGKARRAWNRLVFVAGNDLKSGTPMSYDEVRLFLQSYNAGPYACLKYKGMVPYRETRNYVPKIMRYYQQDLTNSEYDAIIVEKATRYGLDPQLIRAIIKTESNFNRRTVSHAGARGLMQVMPVVWKEMCKRYKLDWNYEKDVFDPEKNIEIACAYLAWLRYDFLPRHFQEFPANPEAPVYVKRDKRKIKAAERISVREQIMLSQQRSKAGASPDA